MIDDPLSLLSLGIWLMAAGMWPVAFLFGACSPCCQGDDSADSCAWLLNFTRCMRVSVVGSDPPNGWDCRVSTGFAFNGTPGPFVNAGHFSVYNVTTEARIPVRLSLSATGASRTPVGETRTQTWRFNRASVNTDPFDIIGPPWFLEVDLTVTGVSTVGEASVTSSFSTDEYGQPKLVLQVLQGPAAITHNEQVELSYVGLQRWLPIDASARNATLASGQSYTGWLVSKPSGITRLQTALALDFFSSGLCSGDANRPRPAYVARKVILDDVVANDFLSGSAPIEIGIRETNFGPTIQVELSILPANQLCEVTDMGIGMAIGLYPEEIYVEVPESFSSSRDIWCGDNTITMRASGDSGVAASCSTGWGPAFYVRRGVGIIGVIDGGFPDRVSPGDFWPGRTLLWRIEHGTYRTSFTAAGPSAATGDWVYSLEGEGPDPLYEKGFLGGCPPGMSAASVGGGTPYDICTPAGTNIQTPAGPGPAAFSVTIEYTATYDVLESISFEPINPGAECLTHDTRAEFEARSETTSGSVTVSLVRGASEVVNGQRRLTFVGQPAGVTFTEPGVPILEDGFDGGCGFQFTARAIEPGFQAVFNATAHAPVVCDDDGELSLSVEGGIVIGLNALGLFPSFGGDRIAPVFLILFNYTIPGIVGTEPLDPISLYSEVTVTSVTVNGPVPFASSRRLTCSDWSPSEVPKEGTTMTRSCELSDGSAVPAGGIVNEGFVQSGGRTFAINESSVPRSIVVAPSPSLLARTISFFSVLTSKLFTGTSPVLQRQNCDIVRLDTKDGGIFLPGSQFGDFPDYHFTGSFTTSNCAFFVPVFRAEDVQATVFGGSLCPLAYQETLVPCEGCIPQVSVGYGEDLATVSFVRSGQRAGMIRVIPKRTWVAGDEMQITVTCGDLSLTRLLRHRSAFGSPNYPL